MGLKWIAKALIQKTISFLPIHEEINFFFQTRISRNLPTSQKSLVEKAKIAIKHYDIFSQFNNYQDLSKHKLFEFGAGWNMCVPLTNYMLGFEHQTVIDIDPHARFSIMNDSIIKLRNSFDEIQSATKRPLRNLDAAIVTRISELASRYDIDYIAPLDSRNTGFAENDFDFISNTLVLQHVPKDIILPILKECFRILKPNGIMSCFIDLNDNYWYTDKSITRYNFLKFSDKQWRKYNSSVHYQNRLRYPEYIKLFKEAGFKILEEKINWPNEEMQETLKSMRISTKFSEFSLKDLGVTSFWIVLEK